MTAFDYVVLFVLGCSILVSTLRGLVKEVLSLVSWVVAFFVANAWSEELSKMLPEMIPGQLPRLIASFVILFLGSRILMMLLSSAVEALVRAAGLSFADRGLGGLFGLARGMVIVMAGVIVCGMTAVPQQAFWKDATLSPLAETAARTLKPWLPGELAGYVKF